MLQLTDMTDYEFLNQAYKEALSVADPRQSLGLAIDKVFSSPPTGRCLVVGAGKAAASMAYAFELHVKEKWPNTPIDGLVITRYEHDVSLVNWKRQVEVVEAAHPVPDQAGLDGAARIMSLVKTLKPGDQLIALISGGGSSLLTLPADGIGIEDLRELTTALLRSGAPIEEMNVVRKHLSAIQGGHLARIAVEQGAQVDAFIISDVTGDKPEDIASGPCAADSSTYADAVSILEKYQLSFDRLPVSIARHLQAGLRGDILETLKLTDPCLNSVRNHVYATAAASLEKAADFCRRLGVEVVVLGDDITGEAQEVGASQAQYVNDIYAGKHKHSLPLAIISGGECTVTIPKGVQGRGGRCSEFLLAFFATIKPEFKVAALAADTDGIDGSETNAGAWFSLTERAKAVELSLDPMAYLKAHEAFGFFEKIGGLYQTGPTLTNVNDFRILLLR